MARMYPTPIDPDTKSDAERMLYEAFRDTLGDDYTVFHSVAWQSVDRRGRARDGETDFVIAHPQRGILVLEVKGGHIEWDPRTGKWISVDSEGEAHSIRNPFEQAKEAKYSLRGKLKVGLEATTWQIHIGHGVAFPDVLVGEETLGVDKPREIVLDATGLTDLSDWVERAMDYWSGEPSDKTLVVGGKAVPALVELLGRRWELRPALWGEFVREDRQLVRLTEQQYQALDLLTRQRRALICGCAGSGKTMLAAEKATRLADQGFRVLLTCFNKNLAIDLRARLDLFPSLDVFHFHELCYRKAEQADVLPCKTGSDDVFFGEQLPQALRKAAGILELRYDAIVVDEGQDFQEHWWVALQSLLADRDDGILYIFFDDNQRLYVKQGAFPIPGEPYCLSVNCRNTQNIHKVVVQFYEAEERPSAHGPVGRPVEVVTYAPEKGLQATLQDTLRRLVEGEHVPADQIAVLGPLHEGSRLWQDVAGEGSSFTTTWPAPAGQVFFGTIYAFKGLERPVIILVELEHWREDLIPLLYTGCSRACNHLIVLLPDDAGAEVQEAFAGIGEQV